MEFNVKRNEKGFAYIEVGTKDFGMPSLRVWVHNSLISKKENREVVELDGAEREVITTEKGNFVLRKNKNTNVFIVGRNCGYRGSSDFELLKGNPQNIIEFTEYQSERGSLGISLFGIISTKDKEIVVKEIANGRLYGDEPEKVYRYFIKNDKTKKELVPNCIEDNALCELLEE